MVLNKVFTCILLAACKESEESGNLLVSYFLLLLCPLVSSLSSSSEERIWFAWCRLIFMFARSGAPRITSCPEPGSTEDKESENKGKPGEGFVV